MLQAYGTKSVKRRLWNVEFGQGRWDCLDRTLGDCVYPYVEKYANNGSILDLGCGSGSTGNELNADKYHDYTGVDISDVAIEKAKKKSEENCRGGKNRYFQSDFFSYAPTTQYDVILLRDSIYYVAPRSVIPMLNRYADHLKKSGVFVVRMMWRGSGKYKSIVDAIQKNFQVVEKYVSDQPEAVVIVFR